jgi:mono/diheme cytochrome c family protein
MKSLYSSLGTGALALVLAACGGEKQEAAPPAAEPAAAPVAAAVSQGQYAVCQTCHQADGRGLPIAIVLHGLQGPLTVHGTTFNGQMAAWNQFSDDDIAATLTYVRSSWGNAASPVTAAQVAKVREETASRTTPWTWEELQKAELN